MHWYPDMMRWTDGMGFGMILFWVFMIILIVILIKSLLSGSHGRSQNDKSPLEILNRRYANGEIDKAQFEKIKKDIEKQ